MGFSKKKSRQKFHSTAEVQSFDEADTEQALNASGVGLWTWNSTANLFLMNVHMFHLLHITPSTKSMDLKASMKHVHSEDQYSLLKSLHSLARKRGRGHKVEWEHEVKVLDPQSGDVSHLRLSSHSSDTGILTGGALDITRIVESVIEQRKIDELQNLNEKHIVKNAQLHTLLRTMAHEVRNPLQGVICNTEFVQQGLCGRCSSDRDMQSFLKGVLDCTACQVDTLNDVLQFESYFLEQPQILDPGSLSYVSIDELVETVLSMFRQSCRQTNVELLAVNKDGLHCMVHAKQLQRILINLVGNATKFTASGSIHVKYAVHDGLILQVSVMDTGSGVSPAVRDRIFKEAGVRTQGTDNANGAGLGLRICALSVASMGGTISYSDRIGGGSDFTARVPVHDIKIVSTACSSPKEKQKFAALEADKGFRVLVADDNRIMQRLAVLSLSAYTVKVVKDGVEVVEEFISAIERGEPYHVCMFDHHMPRMTGLQALKLIREHENSALCTPVVLVTGETSTELAEQIQACRNTHTLYKPYSRSQIVQVFTTIRDGIHTRDIPCDK